MALKNDIPSATTPSGIGSLPQRKGKKAKLTQKKKRGNMAKLVMKGKKIASAMADNDSDDTI